MIQMDQDTKIKLRALLLKHEGYRLIPYPDQFGNLTVGIGHNLNQPITPTKLEEYYDEDTGGHWKFLNNYSWFAELNDDRRVALMDFAFMGDKKFAEFEKMISALEKHDYDTAADELLDSDYRQQVPLRAIELAKIIRTGAIDYVKYNLQRYLTSAP